MRSWLGAFAFGAVFVVNPAVLFAGCGFSYGAEEAVKLVPRAGGDKTYRFAVAGESYDAIVHLSQASRATPSQVGRVEPEAQGLIRSAHACGERTFVRSAGACLDVTKVPVEGTIAVRRVTPAPVVVVEAQRIRGDVVIYGTTLTEAAVELRTATGKGVVKLSSKDAASFTLDALHLSKDAPEGGFLDL